MSDEATMRDKEQLKLLNKLAETIDTTSSLEEAVNTLSKVMAQFQTNTGIQHVDEVISGRDSQNAERSMMLDPSMLSKYKMYFEAWLGIPIEQMAKKTGVSISSHPSKRRKPKGWLVYIPVCALETDKAVFISCIPEWEEEIREALCDASVVDAVPKLREYAKRSGVLVDDYHRFYGLEELGPQIDLSDAVLLDTHHFNQYWAFCSKVYPAMYTLITPDDQMVEDYNEMVSQKLHYCVIKGGEIVSMTSSERVAHKPTGIVNLGINTLNEHRRNGYATTTCAAFIVNAINQGLTPTWVCEFDNHISQLLAEKLGFRWLGNMYSISTLKESWDSSIPG